MRAGLLRHRLSIQEPQDIPDDAGALVTTWVELARMWGEVLPATGSERWIQNMDARVAARAARIRLRYRDDITITEKCRIVWGQHIFNILSIADQSGRNRELVLTCEEINAENA